MSQTPSLLELLAMPFLQRALLAGLLSGLLGGLLGGFAVLRQLSFFTDALGHAALLGIALGVLLGLEPSLVLIPFAVLFALGVNQLAQRSRLPGDALLNIIYSSALALAVLVLSWLPGWTGGIEPLLFGDILGVSNSDLLTLFLLLLAVGSYLLLTGRRQMLLSVDEPLALSRGVDAGWQRLLFVSVLAVVVAISIKAVGVLLISAFVVIPACASRLISVNFRQYLLVAAVLGGSCAVLGLLASGALDLPSGPSVVVVQLLAFLLALGLGPRRAQSFD